MIVTRKSDLLRIASDADNISRCAHLVYWTTDKQPTIAIMMEDNITESFQRIAELLGYRVEKIEQPVEAPEAAE